MKSSQIWFALRQVGPQSLIRRKRAFSKEKNWWSLNFQKRSKSRGLHFLDQCWERVWEFKRFFSLKRKIEYEKNAVCIQIWRDKSWVQSKLTTSEGTRAKYKLWRKTNWVGVFTRTRYEIWRSITHELFAQVLKCGSKNDSSKVISSAGRIGYWKIRLGLCHKPQ